MNRALDRQNRIATGEFRFAGYRRDTASTFIPQRSLWHPSCQHVIYNLTCADFELLLAQAGLCCQRCGKPSDRLYIDHDHAIGDHGVRGLLCPKCNRHLGAVDNGKRPLDELTARYLARPFERQHPFSLQRRSAS